MSHQNEDDTSVRDETQAPRRSYEVPAVIESATFETLALACGKTPGVFECDDFLGVTES